MFFLMGARIQDPNSMWESMEAAAKVIKETVPTIEKFQLTSPAQAVRFLTQVSQTATKHHATKHKVFGLDKTCVLCQYTIILRLF